MTKPKISWPQTPADVRKFIGSNHVRSAFENTERTPHDDDRYLVTAHDLLSAFSEWVEFLCEPEPQPQQEPVAWPHKWGCRANAFGECDMGCTAPQPQRQSLAPVIAWLENGCDPLMAAKELRLIEAAHGIRGEK